MGVKMFGVLLACVWLVAGSPLHPWPLIPHRAITQGSYIRHYGAAWYDTTALREHRDRSRRDVSASGHPRDATLNLRLHALDRVFKMRLVRDTSLFHEDAVFEGSNGRRIPFDPAHTYTGTLEDDENSVVHGIVTKEGLFDGTIVSSTDEIYIEPASRYLHPACTVMSKYDGYDNATDSHDDVVRRHPYQHYHHHHHYHHTIAYRSADVSFPPRQRRTCASEFLRDNELHRARDNKTRNDYTAEDTHSSLYQRPNKRRSRAKPGFYPKDARKKDPTASSHNLELLDKLYRERYSKVLRQRTSVDPKKTICMLYLQADHTFFEHYKSEEACIEVMTSHVQRVNSIYRSTDFNQDGQPDNISFMIKRVKVHGKEALNDPNYRFTGNYGVQEFLELFSEEDYDAFCLSYMFTYRDFKKGTLGLAWSGELTNAAGVCEKNGYYRGSMKSLNTGIITLLNYGKHVPPTISHVTLAHEIGHNFGSPHDPDECSPGGKDGNFIMFAKATSGDKRNNNRFSPCSLASINPVLNAKARSTKGCFAEPQTAICGNGVVEEGEECDCGWEEDCSDPCCHPQRLHHASHEIPCRLADGAVCSPSQGPCCTSGCTLRNGDKCRDDNGCRDASFCDGRGPQCPPSINKPNKTICNEEFVCYMGECTGSICLAYGLESCQCIAGPDDPPTKSCELCCKLPGEDQPCLSSFAWNSAPYDIPDMLSKPGTPCNDYNGYCDVFQRCREVDPSGPLATLRRLFLSDASLASFQRWLIDRWYAVMFVVVVLLAALLALTRLLSKRRISHMRNLSLEEKSSPTSGCLLLKKDFVREGVSARKIRSMDIARIKRRIVETMKSIASPRRKKDVESFDGDTCVTKILRYFEKQAKQDSSKKDETMAERKKQGTESQRRKFESNDTEVPYDRCRRSSDNSVYSDTGEWKKVSLLCLGEHCIGGSRKRAHNVAPSHEETWGKDAPSVERLREPSRLIVSCKTFNNYRTVPLVMPDTPDTPNDTNEARIQTSDLTVLLLPES